MNKQNFTHFSIHQWLTTLFFPILLIYFEVIFRIFVLNTAPQFTFLYELCLCIIIGSCIHLVCSLFSAVANKVLSILFTSLFTLWFIVQTVYLSIFQTPLVISSISGAGQVLQFTGIIFSAIAKHWLPIILIIAFPLIIQIIFAIKHVTFSQTSFKKGLLYTCSIGVLFIAMYLALLSGGKDVGSVYDIYFNEQPNTLILNRYGLLACTKNDIKALLFPKSVIADDFMSETNTIFTSETNHTPEDMQETHTVSETEFIEETEEKMVCEPQIMDINFDALAETETQSVYKTMHQYFSTVTPTYTNEYTGLFKGCNLIYISAESFSRYAIDEKLTPTLYKLANEGFVFNNFYNPVWGVSTSDGEYVNCQGLLPKNGVWSMFQSGDNYLPFTMGNQFLSLGYTTFAYHNHNYDYYSRDVSHPNLGYTYKAYGHGLDITYMWPESDLEMMELSIPDYIKEDHFSIYYMTVSGHMPYSWGGNAMANKHREAVEDLDYSLHVKGYLASHIELDHALEYLIAQLDAAGKLENTVIVMGADHYPYGLTASEIAELAGHEVEQNFELYKSSLIIWNAGMSEKPVIIDKYCSSLDIIPTLSNLFGLEYDSRLLMGQDILSDSKPMVIFYNKSWITDKAMYDSRTGTATALAGDEEVSAEYIQSINQQVSNKFTFSTYILDYDYYGHLFKNTIE